ncbi:MAG TPA: MoxR family ATPase [Bryobacteraceae bacterium]
MMPAKTLSSNFNPPDAYHTGDAGDARADSRTGDVYVFNDRIRLAIQVALATGRPLLVRGDSGWGKSSLAAASARYLKWEFHEAVITSRTQARDLEWNIDLLMRLNDAQARKLRADWRQYVSPGVLWRALDPEGASAQQKLYNQTRGAGSDSRPAQSAGKRAVVLLDEIDKADPDVPNNLLVTLGSLEFQVEETGQMVRAVKENSPLVFITTNEERELPAAFLRRCIELRLPALPTDDRDGKLRKALLVDIVLQHWLRHPSGAVTREYLERAAEILIPPPASGEEAVVPSPAEFKDTILALVDRYGSDDAPDKDLKELAQMTFTKRRPARG